MNPLENVKRPDGYAAIHKEDGFINMLMRCCFAQKTYLLGKGYHKKCAVHGYFGSRNFKMIYPLEDAWIV